MGPTTRPRRTERTLDRAPTAVAALRALRPLGATLLESRTRHPGARFSFIPFGPTWRLDVTTDGVTVTDPKGAKRLVPGAPLDVLGLAWEPVRGLVEDAAPFAGGWVGVLHHEMANSILGTPVPQERPPARPAWSLGHFRFFPDALILDHAAGDARLVCHDFGGEARQAAARSDEAVRRLDGPPEPARPARARGHPSTATMSPAAFTDGVAALQRLIDDGDCFQVNLTASFAYPWTQQPDDQSLVSLYEAYAAANPGPWNAWFDTPEYTLLSGSPELLARLEGDRLELRPIAGTRGRADDPAADEALARDLSLDGKERAEHAMLVDLARNDAARVCRPGTVDVPELACVERYRHVMHLVSRVEGRAEAGLMVARLLAAVFPGGTVTGAPKRRALERIAQAEGGPRGPYTGTLGYVSLTGATQWNLLIRTLVATTTHVTAHAGCGIVTGSRPDRELAELEDKARAQLEAALGRASPAPQAARCGHVTLGTAWRPPPTGARTPRDRRVLLIDFEDSFVYNLADYVRRLGAAARVISVHRPAAEAWTGAAPTHLLLSPGPGRPRDFPRWRDHLDRAQALGIPVLGVCLGHQALAEAAGARIVRAMETVHGRGTPIIRTRAADRDPVMSRWRGVNVGRYHSLVATAGGDAVVTLASLDDGTPMAVRHVDEPWWGLQFHPESLLTDDGASILAAFLEVPARG